MKSKLSDIIHEGVWLWPNDWLTKYPSLFHINIPSLNDDNVDTLVWRNRLGLDERFSASSAWEDIRPGGTNIARTNVVCVNTNIA